tara:strand:+ start:93 stop:923 length:831 start_codon:yes stop_codon:yes gene_type:complete
MNTKEAKLGDINLSNLGKYTGYAPGFFYNQGDLGGSPSAQRRFGNLVTGTALGTAGALSVPVLQYLFPERFKKFPGQGKRLALAAMLGGLAAPFALTLPFEMTKLRDAMGDRDEPVKESKITERDGKFFLYSKDGSKKLGGPYESREGAMKRERQVNYFKHKKSNLSMGQYDADFPLMKSHLASVVNEEISAGGLTPGAAASFMGRVGQNTPTNQPWFTVGDLTRAALGAGAGGVAGSVVGKGVSYFLGLTPKGRKNIRNVGMGLGALINTGKLGI